MTLIFFRPSLKKIPLSILEDEKLSSSPLRNRMMNDLLNDVVPVVLYQEDLNYMKNSIENRCPFLDSDLANFCLHNPKQIFNKTRFYKKYLKRNRKKILAHRCKS